LVEAYSSAIVHSDVGLARRNLEAASITQAVIQGFFDPRARFVDYGAGYGLFVRMMRDDGFDFRWFDRYAENLFARGFEAQPKSGEQFELLTAFEVFEHLVSPADSLEEMLQFSDSILFSTLLMPPTNPLPDSWWYYGLNAGQHVALYSRRSLEVLAERFGLALYSDGHSVHLMTRRRVWQPAFRLLTRIRIARLFGMLRKRHGLTERDFLEAVTRTGSSSRTP
jgi:2-polyprenyl-3-methyl-5-hydroxy-6-metoxy-1,4-benzoquinol methylase